MEDCKKGLIYEELGNITRICCKINLYMFRIRISIICNEVKHSEPQYLNKELEIKKNLHYICPLHLP